MAFTGHVGQTGHIGHTGHTGHAGVGPQASSGSLEVYAGEDESALLVDALTQPLSEEWTLDASGRPSAAKDLVETHLRAGWGSPGQLPVTTELDQARARFWRLAAGPRGELCFGQLMANLGFVHPKDEERVELQFRGARTGPLVVLKRPGYTVFKAHLALVQMQSRRRLERAPEILTQLRPAEAVWASIVGLNDSRHRRTFELIDVALDVTVPIVYRFKQASLCPRPFEYSTQIRPAIMTPAHDSWPSGHSTEAHVTARILATLAEQNPDPQWRAGAKLRLFDAAHRIAENREVAGVHFPTDSAAGQVLGDTLGTYFATLGELADQAAAFKPRQLVGPAYAEMTAVANLETDFDIPGDLTWIDASAIPAHARYFQWLWEEAKKEWKDVP